MDLTGKVYQLEVMLKQLHTDLQKVRPPGSASPSPCLPRPLPRHLGAAGPGRLSLPPLLLREATQLRT